MFSFNLQVDSPEVVLEKHVSVKAAAELSGYNIQYLRSLLRTGRVEFRKDLMEAVIGDWYVEVGDRERHFRVNYANTFGEPVGGLMNVILTEDGQHYQNSNISGGRALVIDIGGFTTDRFAVNPGGEVDYSLARSVPIGIQNVLADFEESFRGNNLQAVKDTPMLPPERIRRAITTGVFEGGESNQLPAERRKSTQPSRKPPVSTKLW